MNRPAALVLLAALVTLSTGARAEAPRYSFTKGPYLQGLSTSGVSIRWEGSEAVGGLIEVTGPDGKKKTVKTDEPSNFHALSVGDLQPSSAYTYRVKVGEASSDEGKFTTPPKENRPFSFLLYGDNRSDHEAHAAVVKAMKASASDFLLHTGDMVYEGENARDWEEFFKVEGTLLRDRCVFACVGNHEMTGPSANQFLRYFQTGKDAGGGRTLFFSMRWSNTRFFFLNAFMSWGGGPDRAWLEQELARADGEEGLEHRVVLLHQGIGSSGPHGGNREMLAAGGAELLKKHKVDVVFAGHDHLYERGEMRGVKYLVSGGGGAPLYPPRKKLDRASQVLESVHHYVEVQVDGPSIKTAARRIDGSYLERCEALPGGWACDGGLKPLVHPSPTPAPASTPAPAPAKKGACDCSTPGRPPPPAPWPLLLAALALLRRSPRLR